MKKIAGRLKIDLSQYRDLEAFSQFGSDLDAATQRTLARGDRLVRTLNQNERSPLPVEDQVVQIYAATNGFLDRINVNRVPEFLAALTQRCRSEQSDLLRQDRRRRLVGRDAGRLRRGVEEFADDFGYDLDEDGQPVEAGDSERVARATRPRRGGQQREERDARRPRRHGLTARRQEPDLLGAEHPEDHARHADGRRRAPAPGRAAHRRAAALRGRDPADDPPGRRAAGERPEPADAERARAVDTVGMLLVTGDRGLAGAFNSQIIRAGHARRPPSTRPRGAASSCTPRAPRRLLADASAGASSAATTRLHRPPGLRQRARDRRGPHDGVRRRRRRPGRDHLQRLHLPAHPGGDARDAAAAAAGDDPRGGRARPRRASRSEASARSSSTSPTPRRSSSASCPTTSRSRSTARCSSPPLRARRADDRDAQRVARTPAT